MKGFFVYLVIVCAAVGWALFAALDVVDGLIEPINTTTLERDQ